MATRVSPKKSSSRQPAVKRVAEKQAPAKQAKQAEPAGKAPATKPTKVKLVRDSFTIPKSEYTALDELKKRAGRAGLPSKKSELLRAGLMALAAMGDASFQAALEAVPRLKTGRPKKG